MVTTRVMVNVQWHVREDPVHRKLHKVLECVVLGNGAV